MATIIPRADLMGFPKTAAAASASLDTQRNELSVSIAVNDGALRDAAGAHFDGLEQPFVIVTDQAGQKQRVQLAYRGTVGASGQRPTVDHFAATLFGTQVDKVQLLTRGVELGFTTNVGEVLLQAPGDSWPVTVR